MVEGTIVIKKHIILNIVNSRPFIRAIGIWTLALTTHGKLFEKH